LYSAAEIPEIVQRLDTSSVLIKRCPFIGVDEYSEAHELSMSAYIQFNDGLEVSKRRVRGAVDVLEETAIFSYLAAAVRACLAVGSTKCGDKSTNLEGISKN